VAKQPVIRKLFEPRRDAFDRLLRKDPVRSAVRQPLARQPHRLRAEWHLDAPDLFLRIHAVVFVAAGRVGDLGQPLLVERDAAIEHRLKLAGKLRHLLDIGRGLPQIVGGLREVAGAGVTQKPLQRLAGRVGVGVVALLWGLSGASRGRCGVRSRCRAAGRGRADCRRGCLKRQQHEQADATQHPGPDIAIRKKVAADCSGGAQRPQLLWRS